MPATACDHKDERAREAERPRPGLRNREQRREADRILHECHRGCDAAMMGSARFWMRAAGKPGAAAPRLSKLTGFVLA